MIRRLRLHVAKLRLALVDAEVARWYVYDGQLSERPLKGRLRGGAVELREQRLEAVRRLESLGGRDPWPSVMREPTEAQRAAHDCLPPSPAKPAEPTLGYPHA